MSKFLRTLWSTTTCEFCGAKHNLGVCPRCGASRTIGEHKFVESPHIEKLRAMKELILRYKDDENVRIADNIRIGNDTLVSIWYKLSKEAVVLSKEQTRVLEYIMRIVNELTGQEFKPYEHTPRYITLLQKEVNTQMMFFLDKMLEYLKSSLDVEEKLADVVTVQNGDKEL